MASRRGKQGAGAARKAKSESPRPAKIHDLFLARLDDLERRIGDELDRPAVADGPVQQFVLDVGREAWSFARDFFGGFARPGGLSASLAGMGAAAPCDELGTDPRMADVVHDVLRPLARLWLGMDAREDPGLPAEGAALLLLNRSAWPLPGEAILLGAYLAETAGKGRPVYVLWEPEIFELPYVGETLAKLGVFAATRENCRTLLERGALVAAFPEGSAAAEKTYESRYRLERFDALSLVEAAVDTGAAIMPGALLGNEESFPVVARIAGIPLTPAFPLFGLLGLLPLPLRWKLRIGSPVEYARSFEDEPGRFEVDGLADAVRGRMQAMLGEMLAERHSIFRG